MECSFTKRVQWFEVDCQEVFFVMKETSAALQNILFQSTAFALASIIIFNEMCNAALRFILQSQHSGYLRV